MSSDPVRYFTARLVDDIDAKIANCVNAGDRNILYAQKAFALARLSYVSEAKNIIRDLRAINTKYETRLSAWIMFAEGIIEHSDTFDTAKAKDRILRGHLIAQVAQDSALASSSAAWLAFFDFLGGSYATAGEYVERAFNWSTEDDSEARARASMVIGSAFQFCGNAASARNWFQRARDYAVKCGDIALQNIILFDSSAFRVSALSVADCIGEVDPSELNFAVLSAQSAGNLNTALGIQNQPSMVPIQRAELFTIEKKWSSAISLFDQHIEQLTNQGQTTWKPKFYAQRAWCKANIGDVAGATEDIGLAKASLAGSIDPDDMCVLHFRVSEAARLVGDSILSDHHKVLGLQSLAVHHEHQKSVLKHFGPIAENFEKELKNPA